MVNESEESVENLMQPENGNVATSIGESSTAVNPVLRRNSQRRMSERRSSERRSSEGKVLQLGNDNTWSVASKNNTKLKTSVEKMSAAVRRRWKPEFWYKMFVGFFFVIIILLVGTTTILYNRQKYLQASKDKILVEEESRSFFLFDSNDNELLRTDFGVNIPPDIKPLNCFSPKNGENVRHSCREWQYRARLNIDYQFKSTGVRCYDVRWQSYDYFGATLKDCFELGDGFWYGMGLVRNLSWPLNSVSFNYSAFVTGDGKSQSIPFGLIIKRYWLSSKGISIRVPLNIPLFVSFNASDETGKFDGKLCFEAKSDTYPYHIMSNVVPRLEYTICSGNNIIDLHTHIAKSWTQNLKVSTLNIPRKERRGKKGVKVKEPLSPSILMKEIFWTTATELFPNVTQMSLQSYADKIMSYGFEPGIIVVDSRWETHPGDLVINRTSFQNPVALFSVLHYKGFKTIITVTPFVDLNADILVKASSEKRLFVDRYTNATLFTNCVESPKHLCALINLMNATTRSWFHRRLNNSVVNELDIDGLMFNGVSVTLMPLSNFQSTVLNPDSYQQYYKKLAQQTINLVGLNTAADSDGLEGFFQLSPLTSSWESLGSIVPTVLTLGLIGCAMINTGSVGGDLFVDSKTFDRELYIRWLELSAFLPIIQFAEPPGRNDLEIIRIAKKFLKVRDEHILPILQDSLKKYKQNGWPIIRPMWWLQPDDNDAYLINDQFVVGNDVIVAPVVVQGLRQRDIYLPSGWWKDDGGQIMRGGKWVRNYQVDLDKVPYFKRTDPNV